MSDWRKARPPTLAEFDALAHAAYRGLPEQFRALCGNVVVHVADFAEDDILESLGIESAYDLTGLYEGVDVTHESLSDPAAAPSHVHLYRRPILEEWAELGDVALGDLITHVLVHEIGHHFGLSDDEMHGIEDEAG
ncbi:MAG: metallopeptidase family protein [Parvularculaceae bacterium]